MNYTARQCQGESWLMQIVTHSAVNYLNYKIRGYDLQITDHLHAIHVHSHHRGLIHHFTHLLAVKFSVLHHGQHLLHLCFHLFSLFRIIHHRFHPAEHHVVIFIHHG